MEWVFVVTRNTGNNVCLSVPWDWVFPWRLLRNIHRGQSRGLGMGYASPMGEGNGNPLQYSCPEKPVDRGAWRAAVQRVAQSRTRLSMHACIGERNGNPLQYSCLENPRDRGAWWAAVYGVAQSRTGLKRLSSSSSSMPPPLESPYQPQSSLWPQCDTLDC